MHGETKDKLDDELNPVLAEINSTRPVLEQVANKWSVLILTVLCSQPSRFNAIKRRLDPITHKALTEALRRLERNGLVHRKVIASSPVAVEYSITPLGRTLQDPFVALVAWAKGHGGRIAQAQQAYDGREDRGASADAGGGGR
ncbi:HxlR family transcriptional regulator [Pseudoduganella lurida]|uniref:HxlR family transcriptional regulator n=1 Tax=Pseudoduganella lurida TaxID=1036180 RepID=A0A562R7N4_9BURK|nr:helix-turn-helix domain-containing protein [Pseudoduganella lurida]TWI64430.1 HxlR family transcriptional regulator [Pseudoduganella lurida]